MMEIVFEKTPAYYFAKLNNPVNKNLAEQPILLDTGSPITLISIPALLEITGQSMSEFRVLVDEFLNNYQPVIFGGYDMMSSKQRFSFIPYILNKVVIGECELKPFMFWVNVTNYRERNIKKSSILLGLDYINQGKKWFDEKDDFHISFVHGLKFDTGQVGAALKQSGEILQISSIEAAINK